MRFAFTEEQELFRDTVRDVLQKECTPDRVRASWAERDGRVPGLWTKLAELGVVGMTLSEDHGGMGLGELDLVLVLEEAGRAALPEPLLETTAVGAPLLGELGGEVASRWLPRVAVGEAVIAVGLERDPFVAAADSADLLILERGGCLYAVPREEASLAMQASVDGSRRLAKVAFEPPSTARIAEGEAAQKAVARALDRGALAASAELVGLSRRMLDVTVDYVKVRHQFGKPIGSFQAVKHHMASALMAVELARPVVYRAAYSMANGDPEASLHASMAKAFASSAAETAAKAALQCHGAIGYSCEHDLHLWMKRAWALSFAWGDAAHHRRRVGDVVLGAAPAPAR